MFMKPFKGYPRLNLVIQSCSANVIIEIKVFKFHATDIQLNPQSSGKVCAAQDSKGKIRQKKIEGQESD